MRFEFALAASSENLSLSFSNLVVSVERASYTFLLAIACSLIVPIVFLSAFEASSMSEIFF
jgi:hypothetical protein